MDNENEIGIVPIKNQLTNPNGLPLDVRTVIDGSMEDEYSNLPDCYEGMLVYSKEDKELYLITDINENNQISNYKKALNLDANDFVLEPAEDGSLNILYKDEIIINLWNADGTDAGLMSIDDKNNLDTLISNLGNLENLDNKFAEKSKALYSSDNDGFETSDNKKVKYIIDGNGNKIYSFTIDSAVFTEDGTSVKQKLNTIQSNINNIKNNQTTVEDIKNILEEIGDSGNLNAVTAIKLQRVSNIVNVAEDGFFIVDSEHNIGLKLDNDGLKAVGLLNYEIKEV